MNFTDGQIAALTALEKMRRGSLSTFLNWAEADSLVELGLAARHGRGSYAITEKGREAFRQLEDSVPMK